MNTKQATQKSNNDVDGASSRIRGVNLGGWLLLERYIAPSLFAITECHLDGDFCWYEGSLSAPSDAKPCSKECYHKPVLMKNVFNSSDYPLDEWHLSGAFVKSGRKYIGEKWLNYHFENFLKKEDLQRVKDAGITHVRVPLPHWILGDTFEGENWIAGDRWKYFVRMCGWAREIGLEVWPNIHTAPGSQNGFDNSGYQESIKTCGGWSGEDVLIQRSLHVVDHVTKRIAKDGLGDVVTGFGILNEPYVDCNMTMYRNFMDDGLDIVRKNLGDDVGVFVSDLFSAPRFNDGEWWLDPERYHDTYLDSHYYHVFDTPDRVMSPKEHIAQLCSPVKGQDMVDCCWQDPNSTAPVPSQGVARIVTEWSSAYDSMPGELLKVVLESIKETGVAALHNRTLEEPRKEFLKKFNEAQIVTYEQATIPGFNHGWFYWTLKLEGGAFAEWDFLRGIEEGWFPDIQPPNVDSESAYGSCWSIYEEVKNNTEEVVHTYPNPWGDDTYWDPNHLSWNFDQEQQKQHDKQNGAASSDDISNIGDDQQISGDANQTDDKFVSISFDSKTDSMAPTSVLMVPLCVVFFVLLACRHLRSRRRDYTSIDDDIKALNV